MKPYGVPRNHDAESPDSSDLQVYGLAARRGNLPGKGGDTHSCFRNKAAKAAARRVWARKARAEAKALSRSYEE